MHGRSRRHSLIAAPSFFSRSTLGNRVDRGRELSGVSDGITVRATRRWWGKRWEVASESRSVFPEPMLVFISRRGMEHGFWRDFPTGDDRFDRDHFVFSDTPALLPFTIGRATRAALAAKTAIDDALGLDIRDGTVRVTGGNDDDDETAIARHLAVHRGLAADHHELLTSWKELLERVDGHANTAWPLAGSVMRRVGMLRVEVRWKRAEKREDDWLYHEDSLRTVVAGNDGRDRPAWRVRRAEHGEPESLVLKGTRFVVTGKPSIPTAGLELLYERTQFLSLRYGAEARLSVAGLAVTNQVAAMLRTIEGLLDVSDSGSPYR